MTLGCGPSCVVGVHVSIAELLDDAASMPASGNSIDIKLQQCLGPCLVTLQPSPLAASHEAA